MAAEESIENKEEPAGRGRSTIEFPYLSLLDAVGVAAAVHEVGGYSCEWDQLAAKMAQAADGGGFRLRVMTARTFGLVTYEKRTVELTELGQKIVDPKREKAARVDAFLQVPLYKVAFERLRGNALPGNAALDQMMVNWGVAPKQREKARQVFIRSAREAGFFDLDPSRLVKPHVAGEKVDDGAIQRGNDGGARSPSPATAPAAAEFHPFITGLLGSLPEPHTDWPTTARAKWLQAAAHIFDLIYTGAVAEISVVVSDKKGGQE